MAKIDSKQIEALAEKLQQWADNQSYGSSTTIIRLLPDFGQDKIITQLLATMPAVGQRVQGQLDVVLENLRNVNRLSGKQFNEGEPDEFQMAVDMLKGATFILVKTLHDVERIISEEHTVTGKPAATHSDDFRSVNWFGTRYTFTPTQAKCVALLWEAWEQGTPEIYQDKVLAQAGSKCRRLIDVFKTKIGSKKIKHPALGLMIVSGATRGSIRLSEPS